MYLGINEAGNPVGLSPNDLLTHGVILGRTGSGKTGLTIALLEEITASGSNAIVFDPKGDLTNLALSLASQEEFNLWVEPGLNPEVEFLRHSQGLGKFRLGLEHVAWWRDGIDVTIYAPGKTFGGGRSINIFPAFTVPTGDKACRRTMATREVSTVLQAIGAGEDPFDPALVYMTEAVCQAWDRKKPFPIEQWPGALAHPQGRLQEFGGMAVDDFFPKRQRTRLARKLVGFRHQSDRWLKGPKLDFEQITGLVRPQIAVFSMRHLSEEDRLFFTAVMMNRLVDFMFETDSSQKLKLLCVLDEARGYLPPYPHNPPTKSPICTILAQGRAQGIGMLIGTQNPMDLDYKALSNVGTWFIGRLRERDCARDLVSELKSRGVDIDTIQDLPQKRFMLLDKHGGTKALSVRWCFNHLRGPLGADDLLRLEKNPPGRGPQGLFVRVKQKRGFWRRLFGKRSHEL